MKCKLEECDKTLKKGQRKFCCESHSNTHYQRQTRLERKKLKELNAVDRFCKYEECGKQLPKDTHAQKLYCPDTKCAYKQNQLDAKRKRDEAKKSKPIVMTKCWNDLCDKEIVKHHRQKYCSKSCRNAQNQRDHKERIMIEAGEYNESKRQALLQNGNQKELIIPEEYLGRPSRDVKEKRFKIPNFSAKWLQDLWDKREDNAKILSCN